MLIDTFSVPGNIAEYIMNLLEIPNPIGSRSTLIQTINEPVKQWLATLISRELDKITEFSHKIDECFDPDWGYVYVVTVNTSAKEALELNLRLQEKLPRIPIIVEWIGEMNISEEDLVNYLAEIVARGGFKAKALPGFSAVEAVRENRED